MKVATAAERAEGDAVGPFAQGLVALHDEPPCRQQHIAGEQRRGGERREGRQPVEGAAREFIVGHREAMHEGAHDGALHQRGKHRAEGEGEVPGPAIALRLEAELEGDAAQDQPDQHEDDGNVERRQHDGVSERKGGEQAAAAEHEPGLVAVPEGGDRVHHGVAVLVRGGKREQHAEAEIVAAEQHVEKYRERQDRRPDQRQEHRQELRHLCCRRSGHGFPAAAIGRCERSASPSSGTGGVASGPRCTSLAM